ncbi:MAG: hypothetical protein K2M31_06420, partial [Muribaculaceae bacterium]|nr:hypothetical protein [Muribaculaceae bacterium]
MKAVALRSQDKHGIIIRPVTATGDDPDEVYRSIEISYQTVPHFDDVIDIYDIEDIFLLKDAIDTFISLN